MIKTLVLAKDNVSNIFGFLVNHKVLRKTELNIDHLRDEESNGVLKNLIRVHLVFNMANLKSDNNLIRHFRLLYQNFEIAILWRLFF